METTTEFEYIKAFCREITPENWKQRKERLRCLWTTYRLHQGGDNVAHSIVARCMETLRSILYGNGLTTNHEAFWQYMNEFFDGPIQGGVLTPAQKPEAKHGRRLRSTADEKQFHKLWIRLGCTLLVTDDEVNKLLCAHDNETGDKELTRLIQEGRVTPDGESYIPEATIEGYNEVHGTTFAAQDWDYDLSPGDFR